MFGSALTGPIPRLSDPADDRRRARLVNEPKLAEILEAFAKPVSLSRLRVAFERIRALVGGEGALEKQGYATREELMRFKANLHDPRHSGIRRSWRAEGTPERNKNDQEGMLQLCCSTVDFLSRKEPAFSLTPCQPSQSTHPARR
jgi:hypothetical protein